ncbi:1-aminocyclopropane-1-carboxylate synthase 7 [Stachybotrys elegans]|uniref:1-aminocyclopropane-1-carboxylate synthase 7 n=1 Tax=Stachybotrys elegans TaxID=80388 RepID=A0A8K0SBC2_9HYPO|nr:1-aminocyclopropane-1-carboxylate synthase 7 [Stachybotrys elegans]
MVFELSTRGAANVEAIWPRISKAVEEREDVQTQVIDMGTSENWLVREEIIDIYKRAIQSGLEEKHLSYPNGLAGDQDLLAALAHFFNAYFKPLIPVSTKHLSTAPGAASALDALLYNICEPGDGVIIPSPCWNGFDWLLTARSSVQPVFAVADFHDVLSNFIPSLERAFSEATCPIKGLLFTNPHNPFGQCYSMNLVREAIKFCHVKKIHFISDEIYAMSLRAGPFISALQIDVQGMGCDLSRVHTIWSISKDFGSSGLRMGCCVTQGNQPLVVGLALASNTQMSSLTAIAATALLTSPELPTIMAKNSERLEKAYTKITSMLRGRRIDWMPSNGPFLFAKLLPDAQDEDEERLVQACKKAGVSISMGRSYHVLEHEKGWARLNFALPPDRLDEALTRLAVGLDLTS